MAPIKESVSSSAQQSEITRQSNLEFLLSARQIFENNSSLSSTANRYYRNRINNLLDYDRDNIERFFQAADSSNYCVHCGALETISTKRFKVINKSKARVHCRHLKGICVKSCQHRGSKRNQFRSYVVKTHRGQLSDKKIGQEKSKLTEKQKDLSRPEHVTPISQIKRKTSQSKPTLLTPPTTSKGPKFSSRLRAFSCLLKE